MPRNDFPHDSAYKAMFAFPSMVKSLLLDFLPEDFVQYFDFSTLKPARASYVRRDFKRLHNDVVWQLNWRGRPSVLVLILEFQSSADYWMSARILAYSANFWLDYIDAQKLKTGSLLPAVFPVVLYNGESPWSAPESLKALIDMPYDRFMRGQPEQAYYVIDAKRVPAAVLARAGGDAAYVIRGEQARTGDQLAEIGMEFVARQTGADARSLDEKVVRWLEKRIEKVEPDWQPRGEKEKPSMMLSELLEKMQGEIKKCRHAAFAEGEAKGLAEGEAKGLAEGKAKGLAEGKAKGLAEGEAKGLAEGEAKGLAEGKAKAMSSQRAGLLEMLGLRFGEIPAEWQDAVEKLASPEQISNLTIAILKAKSQEEYGRLLLEAAGL